MSAGWTVVVAVLTAGLALLPLLAIYLWRGGHRQAGAVVGALVAAGTIAVVVSIATSGTSSSSEVVQSVGAAQNTTAATSTAAAKPKKTPAEIRAEKQRAKRRARTRAKAERIAAAKAAAKAERRAKAHAAYVAKANAWHDGFEQQDANTFWRWREGLSCEDYAQQGCWHVEVITRYGCPSYVAVHANEYRGGSIINELLDNQGYGIPPKTSRVFELDADAENVTANNLTVDCS